MKLAKPWFVVLPGAVYPVDLPAGADVPGELEELAVSAGVAEVAPQPAPRKPKGRG